MCAGGGLNIYLDTFVYRAIYLFSGALYSFRDPTFSRFGRTL